jgi:hypothetical protein
VETSASNSVHTGTSGFDLASESKVSRSGRALTSIGYADAANEPRRRFPISKLARTSVVLVTVAVVSALFPGLPSSSGSPSAHDRDRTFTFAPTRPPATRPGVEPSGGTGWNTLEDGRATWGPRVPASTFGFDAIPRIGGNWPADPTGALGVSWFLTAVNSSYALYDLAGMPVVGPNPLATLFSLPAGTQVFDPKVVYDQYDDTFVLTFLGVNDSRRRSWILVVTIPNATADDPKTWCGAIVNGDRTAGDGRQFADYPGVGYSSDYVVVTANTFAFDGLGFEGAIALAFPKLRLYDCDRTLKFDTFLGEETQNPDGSAAFGLQPATTVGPGRQLLMLSFQPGRPNFVALWRLRETSDGLALRRTSIRVNSVGIAPFATQGGGDLDRANTWWDPGDLRLINAFADLDRARVYGAHVIARDLRPDSRTGGYVESAIRWYEIRVAANLSASRLTRFGTIGEAETDAGWPTLATDADGNLFVTYSRASAVNDEFLSAWVAEVVPGARNASATLLRAGTARMEAVPGPERWGDYNAISRDPVNGAFVAVVNQIAVADGGGATEAWQQTVDLVAHA